MISRQELEGKWKQLKGQIRQQWGQLTEDDLQKVHGDAEQLVGVIQQKTGQTRREIEDFLDRAVHGGQSAAQQITDSAKQYAENARQFAATAGEKLNQGYKQVEEQMDAGYAEAQKMVKNRPIESVIAAFGAGIISGVVVACMMRSNHRNSW